VLLRLKSWVLGESLSVSVVCMELACGVNIWVKLCTWVQHSNTASAPHTTFEHGQRTAHYKYLISTILQRPSNQNWPPS